MSDHEDNAEAPWPPKLNAHGRPWQPGDLILDRYMPRATEVERDAARENLREYAKVILRIATRLAKEKAERERKKFDSP